MLISIQVLVQIKLKDFRAHDNKDRFDISDTCTRVYKNDQLRLHLKEKLLMMIINDQIVAKVQAIGKYFAHFYFKFFNLFIYFFRKYKDCIISIFLLFIKYNNLEVSLRSKFRDFVNIETIYFIIFFFYLSFINF